MQITKKEFSEIMTQNNIVFLGVTRKFLTKDEVYCQISEHFNKKEFMEQRSYSGNSKRLISNNGSVLEIAGEKYSCHKYDYNEGTILVCLDSWYDDFDEVNREKAMYYLVV